MHAPLPPQVKDGDDKVKRYVKWHVQEQPVCRAFWCYSNGCSHSTVENMKRALQDGHLTPPPALPKVPPAKSCERKFSVDAWFLNLYCGLAEPMPTADGAQILALEQEESENVQIECEDHPLWSLGVSIQGNKYAPRRYMNPGTPEGLWQLYSQETVVEKVSLCQQQSASSRREDFGQCFSCSVSNHQH